MFYLYIQINMENDHVLESAGTFSYSVSRLHANRCLPYHVLLYLEDGSWDIRFADTTFTMKAGDVVFMPANIPHFGVSPCENGTRGFYLHCYPQPGDFLTETITSHENGCCFPPVISALEQPIVHELFARLTSTYSSAFPYKTRLCSSLLDTLVVELTHRPATTRTDLHHRLDQLLNKHTDRFLTNQELAEQLHMSPKTLERQFKAEIGKTLHQYQTDRKIETAKKLLLSLDDITLCEIALMLGFYDTAHFGRTFKKKIGVSPEFYRKNY